MELPPGIHQTNLTDLMLDAVCVVGADGRFRYVSAAGERIFGYSPQEMIGKAVIDFVLPADRDRTRAAAAAVMDGRAHLDFENRYVRKDGSIVHVMWSARWYEAEGVRVGVARDVTQLKQTQARQAALYDLSEAAQASEDLPELFRSSHAVIDKLMSASSFVLALQDHPGAPLRPVYQAGDASSGKILRALCDQVWQTGEPIARMTAGTSLLGVPLKTGQVRLGVLALEKQSRHAYGSDERDLLAFVARQLGTAIERKRLHAQMCFMAMHDELTRLPNRRLFQDRLQTALARAQRQESRLALLFIDLNRFKQVNDTHGHLAGDRLLDQVARRLASCVRDTDTLARLGGDEFVVLLENIVARGDVDIIASKIGQALAPPFELGDELVLHASASVGIAHYPEHGDSMDALMARADQDMYLAKQGQAATCPGPERSVEAAPRQDEPV